MCGICGILSPEPVDEGLLRSMCDVLKHRGPDEEGYYTDYDTGGGIGLGHRRLSIIDLEDGRQPIYNEDKSVWIVYNGESYNFQELRPELESKGHRFYTHTDTEVIVHLYEEYGVDCLNHLRGMFAFAIWDVKRKRLFLARDRAGQKPLVYTRCRDKFIFASEIKSILKNKDVERQVDPYSLDLYLNYQYAPAPRTIFKGINKLPPAHYLIYEKGKVTVERYWDLSFEPKLKISKKEAQGEIIRLLEESTKLRLVSDVPLGVFLSGGVDSSAIVAMMARLGVNPIKTFSIGFQESEFNELEYARVIAEQFKTEHKEFIVKPDAIEVLPKLIWHYNEPFADSSAIPTYYVAKMTSEYVKVVLNGDGGDESFGGYERYAGMKMGAVYDGLPRSLKATLLKLAAIVPVSKLKRFTEGLAVGPQERYLKWVSIFDEDRRKALYSNEFLNSIREHDSARYLYDRLSKEGIADLLDRVFYTDIMTYLPEDLLVKVDIAAMANSLEARSPFLDHKLMEFAAKLPSGFKTSGFNTKVVLKDALKGILPSQILNRGKKGFGVPVGVWFRGELKDYLKDILLDNKALRRGYFNPVYVKRIIEEHTAGIYNHTHRLWALLNLELWHRMFIDKLEDGI